MIRNSLELTACWKQYMTKEDDIEIFYSEFESEYASKLQRIEYLKSTLPHLDETEKNKTIREIGIDNICIMALARLKILRKAQQRIIDNYRKSRDFRIRFRELIGQGELAEVRNFLEENKSEISLEYQDELLIFIKKINDLMRVKRLQAISYQEAQIEEAKISIGLLELIKNGQKG